MFSTIARSRLFHKQHNVYHRVEWKRLRIKLFAFRLAIIVFAIILQDEKEINDKNGNDDAKVYL